NKHWKVPRKVNPCLGGPEALLRQLKSQFCFRTPDDQKILVIHGISGAGEREVCIKFAEENRQE
ncbi:hypothetical protein BJ875DRAFT_387486, partial [Amylocarpus encephaloides]